MSRNTTLPGPLMGGYADQLVCFGGGECGDHFVYGVASSGIGCGEQDSGWHAVRPDTAVGEEIEVGTAFTFNAGQIFGGLILTSSHQRS